jgi:hypothetical protein
MAQQMRATTFNLSPAGQEDPVRSSIIFGAALLTGGWLAACSRPSAPDQAADSRHILLATPAPNDSAVASDLEAGRSAKPSPIPQHAQHTRATASASAVALDPAAATTALPAHAMAVTTTTAEPLPSLDLIPAPVAPREAPASPPVVGTGWHGMGDGSDHLFRPPGESRGPVIIIRGGMGGDDDKCDIRPRGHRGGIAINRMTPSFGGGMSGSPPGGIRY